MKKYCIGFMAVLLAVALVTPVFAVEFEYGGLYRLRWQSKDNVSDGKDKEHGMFDDNGNWIDQRLRMYFTFVASERLQLVTKWEADTQWGSAARGGDVGADAVNLEMKNAHIDFMIPATPTRARLGVQGIAAMSGWIIDDDFSAARLTTPIDPVTIDVGYISAQNEDVTDESENIDDWFIGLGYDQGPISANLFFLYQYGHDTDVSTYHGTGLQDAFDLLGVDTDSFAFYDNNFMDIGVGVAYKADMFSAYVNFIKNLGSYDFSGTQELPDGTVLEADRESIDYDGWLIDAGVDLFVQNFTFHLGGFYASGTDFDDLEDSDDTGFSYPAGRSHYWSEILGLGTLDVNVGGTGGTDRITNTGGYRVGDAPSNIWTINVGAAWQALETTKLTFNYWYVATPEDVISEIWYDDDGNMYIEDDNTIGHEIDFYLDQDVVDGLKLRLVGAYLFAEDGYTYLADDDDTYELGARLQWSF